MLRAQWATHEKYIYFLVPNNSQKKARKGLLHSLLCCFGGGVKRTNSPTVEENSSSPAPLVNQRFLLNPLSSKDQSRKCMVIDLDETLVHSSFKVCKKCHMVV